MEGPLSKWTNMIHGWQYRWFVLDVDTATLSYYCSKEKMLAGVRRGCIRLPHAVYGIEDEDDTAFTVTTNDKKTFHLQANNMSERDRWLVALQMVIHRHSSVNQSVNQSARQTKTKELAQFVQLVQQQIETLDTKDEHLHGVIESANGLVAAVKLCMDTNHVLNPPQQPAGVPPTSRTPITSYSSSDDEDTFHDALDDTPDWHANTAIDRITSTTTSTSSHLPLSLPIVISEDNEDTSSELEDQIAMETVEGLEAEPEFNDSHIDFDALYATADESDLKNVQAEHGSVVMHLLSQVSIGMDLTKIVLPTFILERRSLLEMYADFFAHPDLFTRITDESCAESRMIACVRWYLSSFHAGRRSSVAKKPYNPIIGETFRCHWDVPDNKAQPSSESGQFAKSGPFPSATDDQLTFVAEQVSHHPPISAFYAEHPGKRVECSAHIWTKSKFLGLSIGVHMVGEGSVHLLDHGERYVATFPSAYGRSILTTPWIEMGGKVTVKCAKTGYSAQITFHTKPFYGGKTNQVSAEVYKPGSTKSVLSIKGEWNGEMRASFAKGHPKQSMGEFVFLDVNKMNISPKQCTPTMAQNDMESRKLWRHVTAALHSGEIHKATQSKQWLEQRQRLQARQRAATETEWAAKLFEDRGEGVFDYKNPLSVRSKK